ncbi:MAG: hypothetical protein LBQ22_07260 [Bacteroidales bacterium]|jgi:hypothetical protein|nr:hypothetical protein [Bacteroidales bacterium]
MKQTIKILSIAAFGLCFAAFTNTSKAQGDNVPKSGSSSIGIVYNPISGKRANDMFKAGDFVGNTLAAQGSSPYQMFILGDPMISVRYKYKISNTTAFRASLGFSGAKFNYKEYVIDDVLYMDDFLSVEQVEDIIHYKMKGGGINIGLEFNKSFGNFCLVGGFGLVYSFGGGSMKFDYGNKMDEDNPVPSTMSIIRDSLGSSGFYYDIDLANARPLKRYNVGNEHAFGLSLDLGVEWFFMPNLSLAANVSLTPLIFATQPETYTEYEGYSVTDEEVIQFKKKISSGSNYLLYGTENIGLQLSLNYYF